MYKCKVTQLSTRRLSPEGHPLNAGFYTKPFQDANKFRCRRTGIWFGLPESSQQISELWVRYLGRWHRLHTLSLEFPQGRLHVLVEKALKNNL